MGEQGIRLRIGPSRWLTAFVAVSHGGALACVALAGLPWGVGVVLAAAVAASGFSALRRRVLLRGARAVVEFAWRPQRGWELRTGDGLVLEATLGRGCYVTPGLVILDFRVANHRRGLTAVVPADAVGAQDHRRLRVLLRSLPADAASAGDPGA